MRASVLRALLAGACAFFVFAPAQAQQQESDWIVRGEALARRIEAGNLSITHGVRGERQALAERLRGEERLQVLYDIAADDFIASNVEASPGSLAALEREATRQANQRFTAMAAMLRAYAPALAGDYIAARRHLSQTLEGVSDPIVRAAGERLRAYVLADLGLFANSLEAARAGMVHLPDAPATRPLRSGLHDAMAYNAIGVGDYETALYHLERVVELDTAADRPVDGAVIVNNIATMFAEAGAAEEALRLVQIQRRIAGRTGIPVMRFFGDMLCAKVHFLAHDYGTALRCADSGRAFADAPPEYLTRLLVYRTHALARLGRGAEARAAFEELRAMSAERGDPTLGERLALVEPEVLFAEGRAEQAFLALRRAHEASERNLRARFSDGVRELRATMEGEVAQAEQRAQAQAMRSELQARTLEKMTLAVLLAVACVVALFVIALLTYRSRRAMLHAVGRAEEILARRGDKSGAGAGAVIAARADQAPTKRLRNILDEIELRDAELKQAFQELEAARLAAEDASIAKSQFLATMSHELRTPLNAIIGYCEMLVESADERGDTQDQLDLARIHGAAHRLLALINDVLDLSKIEAGAMSVTREPVDVETLVQETVETVRPAAVANDAVIVLDIPKPLGVAETDGLKLGQCLLNLMSNATKFTKDGQITLRARRERDASGDWLTFEVIDTGIGISSEAQSRLFQPFVQADPSTTRAFGGTGLGLAITRRLACLLGGDVTVKSSVGQGSAFTLRVPAKAAAPIAANDGAATRNAA